jgi:Holliday junction resolvase RusA-like endonuclease
MPESNFHVTFILPMSHSWPDKKKAMMIDTPHQQKPDNDNLMKAFKDCLCEEDSNIWDYRITKLWGLSGKIIINELK